MTPITQPNARAVLLLLTAEASQVLKLLEALPRGLTATAIAMASGIPLADVYAALAQLDTRDLAHLMHRGRGLRYRVWVARDAA